MAIDTKLSYSNLTKEKRLALNSLKDDTSIIIKGDDKGSDVALSSDSVSPLINIVKGCLVRVKSRGDIPNETLE